MYEILKKSIYYVNEFTILNLNENSPVNTCIMETILMCEIHSVYTLPYSQAYFSAKEYPIMIVIVIPHPSLSLILSSISFHFAIKAYGYSITLSA